MATCPELFKKVELYAEACGLGDPKDIRDHSSLCQEIQREYDVDNVDRIFLMFSRTASKPIRKLPKKSLIREAALKKVADYVKENKRVTNKHVEFWLYEQGEPIKTEKVARLDTARNVLVKPSAASIKIQSSRLGCLRSAIENTPYISVLHKAMKYYKQEDELGAALCIIAEWAKNHAEEEGV